MGLQLNGTKTIFFQRLDHVPTSVNINREPVEVLVADISHEYLGRKLSGHLTKRGFPTSNATCAG